MSKFHINKHGVPAPCRATKGNCPLGGMDTHFDSIEDAQTYADEQNELNHGLLPKVNQKAMQVQVSQKAFDEVFRDHFNNHGVQYTGPSNHDFNEMMSYPEMEEVYDNLPKKFHDKVKDEEYWVLVKQDNLESHMVNHIMSPSEFGPEANKGYDAMIGEVEKYAPKHIRNNELDWYGKGIDYKLSEDIAKFATEQSLKESDLSINGQSFFVDTPKERDRNWAKEYFESDKYEDFKKTNSTNIQIPQKTFDAVFQNDFNNHGVQYTGPSNHDFNEMMNDSEMKEVYDSLPKEFHDKVKDEEYWVLVKSDNLKSHMVNHMIVPSEFGPEANKGYDAMLEEVGKYAPEHISNNELNWYGKGIDSKLSEDISEFATEQSLKESDLDINGQSFFVDTPKERNRNWAKEYFESGRYEDFKKANNINS